MEKRLQVTGELRKRFLIYKNSLGWADDLQWGSFHTDVACGFLLEYMLEKETGCPAYEDSDEGGI